MVLEILGGSSITNVNKYLVDHIFDYLADKHESVRGAAARILSASEASATIQTLLSRIRFAKPALLRSTALRALGAFEKEAVISNVTIIVGCFADENVEVQIAAVEVIGNLGEAAAAYVPELLDLLQPAYDNDDTYHSELKKQLERLQAAVCKVLGMLGEAASKCIPLVVSTIHNIMESERPSR